MARFFDQVYQPLTQPAQSTTDYTVGMTRDVFKDPRFLKDAREYFASKGLPVAAMNDGEIINRLLSEGTWREMGNSVSLVKGLVEAGNATADERERLRRLQSVYDIAPGIFQEGGRGVAGLVDNIAAAVLDPVNLIGGIAGKGAGQAATRTALATGATSRAATRAGLKAGIGKAAVSEGAINAAIEGGVSIGTQARDVQLGIRDDISLGEAAVQAGVGGTIGAALGGLVAAPSAAVGAKIGSTQYDQLGRVLRGSENPDAAIAGMTNEQAAAVLSDPNARAAAINQFAPVGPQIPEGGLPAQPPITAPVGAQGPSITLDAQRLEARASQLRKEVDALEADGLFDEAAAVRKLAERVANLEGFRERLVTQSETIGKLTKSADPKDLDLAAKMRARFEEDYSLYRAVMDTPEDDTLDARFVAAASRPPLPTKPADAASPEAPMTPASTTTEAAPTPATTPAPVAQDVTPAAEGGVKTKGRKPKAAAPAEAAATPAPKPTTDPITAPAANATPPADQPATGALTGRKLTARFLELTQPLLASGMTRTDMTRALNMITRGLGMDEKEATRALTSFTNKIDNMRKRGELRAGDDMDMTKGGIFDRSVEGMKLGDDETRAALLSLRQKLVARTREVVADDAAERAADAGVAPRPTPKAEKPALMAELSPKEGELLRLLVTSEKRENPDFTTTQARQSAIVKLVNMRSLDERSATPSNAARMEAMAPADPKGRGTTSTPIAKGSDYTVARRDFVMKTELNLEAAKAAAVGTRGQSKGLVPFIAGGREKVVGVPGGRVEKGTEVWYDAMTNRVYADANMARKARGEDELAGAPKALATPVKSGPVAGEATATVQLSLTDLLRRYDPKGDGSGDGAGLWKALEDLSSGKVPDLKPAKPAPAPKNAKGGLLIVRRKSDGSIRMMGAEQAERGGTLQDLLGKSKAEDWEVRYTPEGVVRTRDPQKLAEIFERSIPEAAKPTEAETKALTFAEAKGVEIDLSPDEAKLLETLGHDANAAKIDALGLADLIHNFERMGWKDLKALGGVTAYANILERAYAIQARINPLGVVLPQQTRAEAIEALENIFGARNPAEVEAGIRLLKRLAGDAAPDIRASAEGSALMTNYGRGEQYIELQKQGVYKPRVLTLYHEVAHWAYWNILTPEDRLSFWRDVVAKYTSPDGELGTNGRAMLAQGIGVQDGMGVMVKGKKVGLTTNAYTSPQEFFANQFEVWAARKLSGAGMDEAALDQSIWKKLIGYVEALYDRYVRGVQIDPMLEPLFSKILPEEDRLLRSSGVKRTPDTPLGKALNLRLEQTRYFRKSLDEAVSSGSTETIIETFNDAITKLLLSLTQDSEMNTGIFIGGRTRPIKRLQLLIGQRVADFNQITTGKRPGTDSGEGMVEAMLREDGLTIVGDRGEVGEQLARFYQRGYQEGGIVPEDAKVQAMLEAGRIKRLDQTSFRALLDLLDAELVKAYHVEEGGIPAKTPAKTRPEVTVKPAAAATIEKHLKTGVRKRKRVDAAVDASAKAVVTGRGKPAAPKAADPAKPERKQRSSDKVIFADSLRLKNERDLRAAYLEVRKAGDQVKTEAVASSLISKLQSKPVPAKKVTLPAEFKAMGKKELETAFLDALYEGNAARINETAYELTRRAANKKAGAEGKPLISAIYDKSVEAIQREIEDNMGVPTSVGIPPNARAQVREILSYMTHREPQVQFTLRTMAYRMLNLMGKTTHNTLDEAGIISTDDLSRLANVDPSRVTHAAFVDFRAEEFKGFRSDLRRVAIALNRGSVDPIDLMHEVGHMVIRTGVLSREESEGILELFRAANDPVKDRIVKLYAGKYAHRVDGPQLVAEEWFAEQLALYMAERVTRGDIFNAAITGDFTGVSLRGSVDRAIDRMVEFVAYVVNGLLGKDDLRQTFRRLTFYGDMFAANGTPPLGKDARLAMHRSYAAAYAADRFMAAPKNRANQVLNYVGRGVGFDADIGQPRVFFHGTPRGDQLARANNPQAVMLPSRNGQYGPGIYITENAGIADTIYSKRPTLESLQKQYRADSNNPDLDDAFEGELNALHNVRRNLNAARREYTAKLFEYEKADQIGQEIILEDLDQLREDIDLLITAEADLTDGLSRDFGLAYEPLVMPLYVRMLKPADFQMSAVYTNNDPFVRTVTDHLVSSGLTTRQAVDTLLDDMDYAGQIDGSELYTQIVGLIEKRSGGSLAARVSLNGELEKLGYDGLVTTHVNMGSLTDDLAGDGIAYAGEPMQHQTLVVFDSKNVKHVEAAEFDENVPQVYFRETLPRGTAGNIITSIADMSVEGLSGISPARVGETAEATGAGRPLSGALMSMLRRRTPTPDEQRALMDTSPMGYLRSQSSQMERMGMNWMARDYKDYFPRVYERFAARLMPTISKINALPDARNGLSGWFYKATGGIGQKAPESNALITRAIRNGVDSRHWKALTPAQRQIAQDVKATFRSVFRDLRKAGVMLGDLGEDYVPQVWKKDLIVKNRDEFLSGMATYYKLEHTSLGRVPEQDEANKFAERMYNTLAGVESDGVFIPGGPSNSGSRNPTADHVDFNRMIRLSEYPAAQRLLEKFVEDDILSLATKYVEAAERRLLFVNKWGVNGHAFHDYLKVAQSGVQGVADLLSKNKEFRRSFQFLNEQGVAEEGSLIREVQMPFEGRDVEAREFAARLLEAHGTGGGATTRKMLMEIAPLTAKGEIHPAYERRVDAIVGALDDFKGRPALTGEREEMFVTNAMQVLMQKRQIGTLEAGYRFSNTVRNFNNISLLGFTTLSSIGDLALPLIRSGSMKDYLTAMKNFAADPTYREMIFNTGVAIESMVHERMLDLYGGGSDKLNQAFFNATLLTPWTDFTRQIAGSVGYESLRTMQKRALDAYKPGVPIAEQSVAYKTADRYLKRYGLGDFLPNGSRAKESISPELARSDEAVRLAIIKFADETVFVPNPNDIPLWAQTPIGKIVWQLKSFPMMMSRFAGDILMEARKGNVAPLMYLLSVGPAFGMTALAMKDIVQMRGGEDDREAALRDRSMEGIAAKLGFDPALHGDVDTFMGWYLESLMLVGGFGLVGDILYGIADNAENGAYGQVRMASLIGGPTVGLGFSAYNAYAGVQDAVTGATESNAKERSGVREVISRVPIIGGIRSARESITDAIAGEATPRGNGWAQPNWSQPGWRLEE